MFKQSFFSFLWKNKKDKKKRTVMYQPLSEGGLDFVNFSAVVKSLRLAWISRLLSSTTDSWKAIPNYYFNTYGGLKFLLKCNYNVASICNGLPTLYIKLSIGSFYNIFKSLKIRLKYFRTANSCYGITRK